MADRTITKTGVVIGGHFIEPAPAPSRDAELIQTALLNRHPNHAMRVLDLVERNLGRWCVAVIVIGFLLGLTKGRLW